MKKLVIIAAILIISINSKAQDQVVVDPNAEIRVLNGSFNEIKISGGMDLYLTQSQSEAIAVSSSEEKFKAGIKTIVENKVLKIYFDGDKGWSRKNKQIKVYVSFINLQSLYGSGATDIIVAGKISVPQLELKFSGASVFKGHVYVNTLNIDLSGASDINIAGRASTVFIKSSGASDVNGFGLITDMCNATASGASDIEITVNKELAANASGASKILYQGDGVMTEIVKSGASVVSIQN